MRKKHKVRLDRYCLERINNQSIVDYTYFLEYK